MIVPRRGTFWFDHFAFRFERSHAARAPRDRIGMATVFIECSLKLILIVNQWSNEIIIVLFAVVVQFSYFHLFHRG